MRRLRDEKLYCRDCIGTGYRDGVTLDDEVANASSNLGPMVEPPDHTNMDPAVELDE
jgi:hypothetical protein